ncbi:MAG TPA: MOSC domain-containing protein [Candidatus Wunengus sp. YC61]|uniref:MOSC domain-containing protein n=1 Tax=Candidatus Wunengus sp. YC61 TaxID=3367698 RepID=UPI0040268D62
MSEKKLEPRVIGIFVCPVAGERMQEVFEVEAIAGAGLKGDRYCTGEGSFNKGNQGKRQATLINGMFFEGGSFYYPESRRNIVTMDVELMWLIGREFQIGNARFRGVKYCDPCNRPNKLCGKSQSFKEAFFDRGGIVAEILEGGLIKVGGAVILPPKGY